MQKTENQKGLAFRQGGFTLLEILLVVALIGILAAIAIVAINPGRQVESAKNAQREADVNTISSAISQYIVDNAGALPEEIPDDTANEICATDAGDCTGLVDLSVLTNDGEYMPSIPMDPDGGDDENGTGYLVLEEGNGRVTVSSHHNEDISVTR